MKNLATAVQQVRHSVLKMAGGSVFKVKCPVIARDIGCEIGAVIVRERADL